MYAVLAGPDVKLRAGNEGSGMLFDPTIVRLILFLPASQLQLFCRLLPISRNEKDDVVRQSRSQLSFFFRCRARRCRHRRCTPSGKDRTSDSEYAHRRVVQSLFRFGSGCLGTANVSAKGRTVGNCLAHAALVTFRNRIRSGFGSSRACTEPIIFERFCQVIFFLVHGKTFLVRTA